MRPDERTPILEPRQGAPFLFELARGMERKHVRGSTRLIGLLGALGMLDRPALLAISDSLQIEFPLARTPWDQRDLDNYEIEYIASFAALAQKLPSPVTFIDVGADIGIFALKMFAKCPGIQRMITFEPNPEGYSWLLRNLARLPLPAEAVCLGVADFEGGARLVTPEGGDYAANYLQRSNEGPIRVTTLDAYQIRGANVCLKIDVEGGEAAVLRGAAQTIQSAKSVVIGLEAHPKVCKRTGSDPVECLRLLQSWHPFEVVVSETGVSLDSSRPVFEQIEPNQIYNLGIFD